MRNEMVLKGLRITAFAAVMFTSASLFATQIISLAPSEGGGDGGAMVGPVNDSGNIVLTGTDGTWIFNTNSSAANWSTTSNWASGIVADGIGAKADFSTIDITGARTPNLDTSRTVGRIDIGDTNNTHSYTITATPGASLTFDNTSNSANAQLNQTVSSHGDTISAPLILTSSLDVTNASSNTLTLSGAISGAGALNLSSGTLALGSSVSTFSGGTTINGGKITIGSSGTPLGSGTLTLGGGTLQTTASRSTAMPLNVVVSGNSVLSTTSTANPAILNFSGTLSGSAGSLTIRSDATAGQFDVRFSGGDFTMAQPITIDNGSTGGSARLSDFNSSGTTHTYSGVISGNGSYNRSVSSGSGGLTVFLGDNTYTGTTTVNIGTLQLGNGGTTGSLSPSSVITINAGGVLRFDHTAGSDFVQGTNFSSSAITGLGQIVKDGTASLTFNVANTFSGGLTINKGTVVSGVDGSLGTGNISLTAGNITLTLNGASNNIADTATLSYVSTDTINLNNTTTDTVTALVVDDVTQGPGVYGNGFNNPDNAFFGVGTITVVPEPATWGMMLLGGGLLTAMRRFRRKTS
jgi:autotransporter-associated beta strand protein